MPTNEWLHSPNEAKAHLLGAASAEMTSITSFDLEDWIRVAVHGHLAGLSHGHRPGAKPPDHMQVEGPLRQAIISEFAFRALAEEMATRAIGNMVRCAPSIETMEFYATQLFDEARHANVFRAYLCDLGLSRESLSETILEIVGERKQKILDPLDEFAGDLAAGDDFFSQVVLLTVIVEGALAPAAEMSAQKWWPFDRTAAQICEGTNLDEVRHLGVGSVIVRDHLLEHPLSRPGIENLVRHGMKLWQNLPISAMLIEREVLYQRGIAMHPDLVQGYRLANGQLLADTTVDDRLLLQQQWSDQMRSERLAFMTLQP